MLRLTFGKHTSKHICWGWDSSVCCLEGWSGVRVGSPWVKSPQWDGMSKAQTSVPEYLTILIKDTSCSACDKSHPGIIPSWAAFIPTNRRSGVEMTMVGRWQRSHATNSIITLWLQLLYMVMQCSSLVERPESPGRPSLEPETQLPHLLFRPEGGLVWSAAKHATLYPPYLEHIHVLLKNLVIYERLLYRRHRSTFCSKLITFRLTGTTKRWGTMVVELMFALVQQ